MPELHLWHQSYSSVSASPCGWSRQLLVALRAWCSLLQVCADLRKPRWLFADLQNLFLIFHFPFFTRKLSGVHSTMGSERQCVLFGVAPQGLWELRPCGGVGGQPRLFLVLGWWLPAWARNTVSHSIKDGFMHVCVCVCVCVWMIKCMLIVWNSKIESNITVHQRHLLNYGMPTLWNTMKLQTACTSKGWTFILIKCKERSIYLFAWIV